jgi:hypothetical protein
MLYVSYIAYWLEHLSVACAVKCWLLSGRNVNDHQAHCDCPSSCYNIDYDATVSTSHMSDRLIYSLLGDESGRRIRTNYLRAREVHARIDDGTHTSGLTIEHSGLLMTQFEQLRALIDVDFLNDSTSTVGLLLDAVDAIVQQTAQASVAFRSQIFETAVSADGCWSDILEKVLKFNRNVRFIVASINQPSLESNVLPDSFARFLLKKLGEESLEFPPALLSSITGTCDSYQEIKTASALMLADGRCDKTKFCEKFSSFESNLEKMARQYLEAMSNVTNITSHNFSHLVNSILQEADTDVNEPAQEILRDGIATCFAEFDALFQMSSITEMPQCDTAMNKWVTDIEEWLSLAILSNYNSSVSFLTMKSIRQLNVLLGSSLQWLDYHIKDFNLGVITKVSGVCLKYEVCTVTFSQAQKVTS